MSTLRKIAGAATAGLAGAAVVSELRKPPGKRQWHGRIAGVPYDFRAPTAQRLRAAFWNPDSDHILSPHAFGVGWSVDVGRLVKITKEIVGARHE